MLRPGESTRSRRILHLAHRNNLHRVATRTSLPFSSLGPRIQPRHPIGNRPRSSRKGVQDEGQRHRQHRRRPRVLHHGRRIVGRGSGSGAEVRSQIETEGIGTATEGDERTVGRGADTSSRRSDAQGRDAGGNVERGGSERREGRHERGRGRYGLHEAEAQSTVHVSVQKMSGLFCILVFFCLILSHVFEGTAGPDRPYTR